MRLCNPHEYGLFTVSEAEENEAERSSSRCPSWLSTRSSASDSSAPIYTPRSEAEDPFEFWSAVCDEPPVPPLPSGLNERRKRPPPLDLAPYPRSSSRLPRVSACEPKAVNAPLLPALPIRSPLPNAPKFAKQPEPEVPIGLGIMTPNGVNIVSALRELLTSCGEYDEFCDDEMFADADDDEASMASAPVTPTTPVTPQMAYTIPMPRAPRPKVAPREHRNAVLFGDHSYLQSLSNSPADAEDEVPALVHSWNSASSRTPNLSTPYMDEPLTVPTGPMAGSLYSMPNVSLEDSKRISSRSSRSSRPPTWRYV